MKRTFRLFMKRLVTLTTRGFDTGAHVTRYAMYERLSEYAGKLEGEKVLSISHSERLCGLLGFDEDAITDASYPEANILDLTFDDETFDCVVSD